MSYPFLKHRTGHRSSLGCSETILMITFKKDHNWTIRISYFLDLVLIWLSVRRSLLKAQNHFVHPPGAYTPSSKSIRTPPRRNLYTPRDPVSLSMKVDTGYRLYVAKMRPRAFFDIFGGPPSVFRNFPMKYE